nr:CP [Caladenia virus A]
SGIDSGGVVQPPIPPTPTNGGQQPQGQISQSNQLANLLPTQAPAMVRRLYTPPPLRAAMVNPTLAKRMGSYTPPAQLISDQASTLKQLETWMVTIAEELEITIEQFSTDVLPFFIYWCIVNGASDKHGTKTEWKKANYQITNEGIFGELDEVAPQTVYPLEPFIRAAKPTLRAIMRHFGPLAYKWVKASVQNGQVIKPANATHAGLDDPRYFPCCVDFVTADILTTEEVSVRNQVINARTMGARNVLFRHATAPGAVAQDTNLRLPTDSNYGRTQIGGFQFDQTD